MKYMYDFTNRNLIKNYTVEGDKIIVSFLAYDKKIEIPFNEENEENLLKLMTHQAIERNNSDALFNVENDRIYNMVESIAMDFLVSLGVVNFVDSNLFWKVVIIMYEIAAASVIWFRGIDFKKYNEDIEELKKYDIYLSIENYLKALNSPKIFKGIKNKEDVLNINTLDNYSLKDIKKIRSNLIKVISQELKKELKEEEKLNKVKEKKLI